MLRTESSANEKNGINPENPRLSHLDTILCANTLDCNANLTPLLMKTVSSATLTILLCPILAIGSPSTDSTSIKEVEAIVIQLFEAMREGDSTLARDVFHDNARLASTFRTKAEGEVLHEGDLLEFLTAIGTPHDELWDERISNLHIQVDENLAHAWMDYSFYINDNLSHCGVNAMQLVRLDDKWRILNITDTRRRLTCEKE